MYVSNRSLKVAVQGPALWPILIHTCTYVCKPIPNLHWSTEGRERPKWTTLRRYIQTESCPCELCTTSWQCDGQDIEFQAIFISELDGDRVSSSWRWYVNIITCMGAWLTDRGLDWMTRFIDTLFTQLGTTGNTALSLFYILYSSSLHTH
jgi:hypothetical protein